MLPAPPKSSLLKATSSRHQDVPVESQLEFALLLLFTRTPRPRSISILGILKALFGLFDLNGFIKFIPPIKTLFNPLLTCLISFMMFTCRSKSLTATGSKEPVAIFSVLFSAARNRYLISFQIVFFCRVWFESRRIF